QLPSLVADYEEKIGKLKKDFSDLKSERNDKLDAAQKRLTDILVGKEKLENNPVEEKEIDMTGIKKVIVKCSELANKELQELQGLVKIATSEQEKEAYRKEQRDLETIIEQAKQVVLQLNTKLVDKEVEQVQAQTLQFPKTG